MVVVEFNQMGNMAKKSRYSFSFSLFFKLSQEFFFPTFHSRKYCNLSLDFKGGRNKEQSRSSKKRIFVWLSATAFLIAPDFGGTDIYVFFFLSLRHFIEQYLHCYLLI